MPSLESHYFHRVKFSLQHSIGKRRIEGSVQWKTTRIYTFMYLVLFTCVEFKDGFSLIYICKVSLNVTASGVAYFFKERVCKMFERSRTWTIQGNWSRNTGDRRTIVRARPYCRYHEITVNTHERNHSRKATLLASFFAWRTIQIWPQVAAIKHKALKYTWNLITTRWNNFINSRRIDINYIEYTW